MLTIYLNVQERVHEDSEMQEETDVNAEEDMSDDDDGPPPAGASKDSPKPGTPRTFHTMELGRILRDSEFDDTTLEQKRKEIDRDCTAFGVTLTALHQSLVLTIALSVDPAKKDGTEKFLDKAMETFDLDLNQYLQVKGTRL